MTAKYPVDIGDEEGIVDAVNYLLSGPSGLGQNFAGFSTFEQGWLTGNFRSPYGSATLANLYVAPIALTTSEMLDGRTWKFTFASTQPSPPFQNGNGVTVDGTSDSWYNDTFTVIGVVSCTTDYVIVRTTTSYAIEPPASGGDIRFQLGTSENSTDANARVTVTGGTDRVFISGQLNQYISYDATGDLQVTVAINKYYGEPDTQPVNPDYLFNFQYTVARKVYNYPGLSGVGTLPVLDTVFATVIDQPDPTVTLITIDPATSWTGYFWYILEVSFEFTSGTGVVTSDEFALRSLSAQVVKQ